MRNSIGTLIIAGGTSDHIHLLIEIKRDVSVADALRLIKTNSSKWIHEQYPTSAFSWQTGYSSFSVSRSVLPKAISYIQNQEEHHKMLTFQDEYRMFLKGNGIEFDEKYMWD